MKIEQIFDRVIVANGHLSEPYHVSELQNFPAITSLAPLRETESDSLVNASVSSAPETALSISRAMLHESTKFRCWSPGQGC